MEWRERNETRVSESICDKEKWKLRENQENTHLKAEEGRKIKKKIKVSKERLWTR